MNYFTNEEDLRYAAEREEYGAAQAQDNHISTPEEDEADDIRMSEFDAAVAFEEGEERYTDCQL